MTARYCSSACQKDDRPVHKLVCKVLGDVRENAVTSLAVAAWHGDVEKVRNLLDAGAKVNKATGRFGITALYAAADYSGGAEALVAMLLRAGAKVDKAVGDDYEPGRTALHAATHRGHAPTIALLVQAGADVNRAEGNAGCTALMVNPKP
jgi:ankyrin repeat protein